MPTPLGWVGWSIGVHEMFEGRGMSESVTVSLKSPIGFTTMVELA